MMKKIKTYLKNGLGRSMFLSTVYKPVGMLLSFLYTPLLLNYLGEETYGIWSTILSIINWINYFDVGIGNGLRNQLTKDISLGDKKSAQLSNSTAYIILSVISSIVFVLGSIAILLLDTETVFNTFINVKPALYISFTFICLNFVLALSKVQLYATQQAEKVGLMTVLTQLLNILGILLLEIFNKGNMLAVAVVVGLSGLLVNIIFTRNVWRKNQELIPHILSFRKEKVRDIGSLGIKFFVIQIAAMILYTTDNLIITQIFGPTYVTPYNTVYTAFGLINGLFAAMMMPLWSKYTVAMEQKNYVWIRKTIINLDKLLIPLGIILVAGVFVFEPLSVLWLHKTLYYEKNLVLFMAIYYWLYICGSIYSTAMNGMGKVNLQMVLAILTAILNIPLSVFLGKTIGMRSSGVLLATIICMLISDIPIICHVHRYLNRKIDENK